MKTVPSLRWLRLPCLLLLTSAFLPACSSPPPMPPYPYGGEGVVPSTEYPPDSPAPSPASYRSSLHQTNVASRQNVAMSDEEEASQPAGTSRSHQTASSETVVKNGKIKKQTTTNQEVIETDTSTTVETLSIPTSDQDVR